MDYQDSKSQNFFEGDGETSLFAFTFPYISEADVHISIDGVEIYNPEDWRLEGRSVIATVEPPAVGAIVEIFRVTNSESPTEFFYPGSAITARSLNVNFQQLLYIEQESATQEITRLKARMKQLEQTVADLS